MEGVIVDMLSYKGYSLSKDKKLMMRSNGPKMSKISITKAWKLEKVHFKIETETVHFFVMT